LLCINFDPIKRPHKKRAPLRRRVRNCGTIVPA
jgi:hypothetical protein